MQKYKTFIVLLILIATWASFFSSVKFFLWGELNSTLHPNLQTISALLALGSFFAYFIGGALAYTFLEKYLLFTISILTTIFVSMGYFIGYDSNIFFVTIIIFLGIFYGLWASVKNILISIEIRKTMLPDTMVNAFSSIIFVSFIIIGSILGNLLYEVLGHTGYILIMYIPLLSAILSLMLNYEKITLGTLIKDGYKSYFFDRQHKFIKSMKEYVPEMKFIIKKYYIIIILSSILWTSSAILYQQLLEYSIDNFSVKASTASIIFLFSAIGLMIGNILSIKMNKKRWIYFIFSNAILSFLIALFPLFLSSFYFIFIIAFIIAIFFGVSTNLVDSYFFRKIGDDYKKEYGSSVYGLIFSIVVFVMMLMSIFINGLFGLKVLTILISLIIVLSGFFTYIRFKEEF